MKWENRKNYFPPGYEYDREIRTIFFWLLASITYSIRFLPRYFDARGDLYVWMVDENRIGVKVVREGARMAPFPEILGDCFLWFAIGIVMLLVYSVLHYLYYYQESKSILLVRRLPDRWFVWRSCFAGALIGTVIILACVAILCGIYYMVYRLATPAQCLY